MERDNLIESIEQMLRESRSGDLNVPGGETELQVSERLDRICDFAKSYKWQIGKTKGVSMMIDLRNFQDVNCGFGIIEFPGIQKATSRSFDCEKLIESILIADFISEKNGLVKAHYPEEDTRGKLTGFSSLVMGLLDAKRLLKVSFAEAEIPEKNIPELFSRFEHYLNQGGKDVQSLYLRSIISPLGDAFRQ